MSCYVAFGEAAENQVRVGPLGVATGEQRARVDELLPVDDAHRVGVRYNITCSNSDAIVSPIFVQLKGKLRRTAVVDVADARAQPHARLQHALRDARGEGLDVVAELPPCPRLVHRERHGDLDRVDGAGESRWMPGSPSGC